MSYDKIVPKSNQLYHVPLELHIDEVLSGIIDGTIKINIQIPDVSNLPNEITRIDTELGRLEDVKVDKIPGKGLSDENFSLAEKNKLAGIADEATKNQTDAELRDRTTHTGEQPISTITNLQNELDNLDDIKVDKVPGQGLSDENFTLPEKNKLASLESSHWKGEFLSEAALYAGVPNPQPGDYANVDVPGENARRFIWDSNDNIWVEKSGIIPDPTPAQIKDLYEDNPDTNAYTDAEKAKLAGIATEATKNATDAQLRDRTTHTGEQPISTVTGLQDGLDSKVNIQGDQTIQDVKTFTSSPIVPTPTSDTDTSNKKYVDDSVSDAINALDYIESEGSDSARIEWINLPGPSISNQMLGYTYSENGTNIAAGLHPYGLLSFTNGELTYIVGANGIQYRTLGSPPSSLDLTADNLLFQYSGNETRVDSEGIVLQDDEGRNASFNAAGITILEGNIYEISGGKLRYGSAQNFLDNDDIVSKKYVDDAIVESDRVPVGAEGQFIGYNSDNIPVANDFSFETLGVPEVVDTSTTPKYVYGEDASGVKYRYMFGQGTTPASIPVRLANGNISGPTESDIGNNSVTNSNWYVTKEWSGNITPAKHRLVVNSLTPAPGTKTLRETVSEERLVCQNGAYTINHYTPTESNRAPITYLVLDNADLATIAWGSTIKWSNNEPPEFDAGHRYRLGFIWDVDSERWIGSVVTVEVL